MECRRKTGGVKGPTSTTVRLVYVIGGHTGPVKIGVASNPGDRLAQLCATSDTTKMPTGIDRSALAILFVTEGDKGLEGYLHRRFRDSRVLGEWFDLGPPEVACERIRMEIASRAKADVLDLELDSLNGSKHVKDLVRNLYMAVLDPATRVALKELFPEVLGGDEYGRPWTSSQGSEHPSAA